MSEWDAFPVAGAAKPTRATRPAPRPAMPSIQFADDRDALTRTVIGEARNQGDVGMTAVAATALNRSRQRRLTPTQVVLEKNQFEPWGNPETARSLLAIQPADPVYQRASAAVDRALAGDDPTGGASHFYAPKAQQALGRAKPSWDDGSGRMIGDHMFFNLDGGAPQASTQTAPEGWDDFPLAETPQPTASVAGSSADAPIDLTGKLYQDQVDALKQGAWVMGRDGEVYQLPGDAFTSSSRPSDEAQGGNVFMRRPNLEDRVGAYVTAASEQVPGLDELTALTTGALTGEGYSSMRESQMIHRDLLNQTERGARVAGGVSGALGTLAIPGLSGANYIKAGVGGADKAARAFQVGAGASGAFGFGNTDGGFEDRAQAGAISALIGGPTAGVLQAGAPLAANVAKRFGSGLSEAGSVVGRGFGRAPREAEITPEATESAAQYVQRLIDSSGSDLATNPVAARGKPITAAEAIGPSGVTNMTALSRRAGRSGAMVQDVIGARALEQSARVLDDLASASGLVPGAAEDAISSLARTSREAASPLYDAAYAATNVDSPILRDLMRRPSVRAAMNKAVKIAQDEGRDPSELGFVTRAVGMDENGLPILVVDEVTTPSMQTWDYVKQGMDDVLETYRDKTTRRMILDKGGRAAESNRQALRSELANTEQPWGSAYRAALDAGGDAPRVEAAFREGPNLFSSSVNERTFRNRVEGMNEVQRSSTLSGIVDDLYNKSRNGRLNLKQLRTAASREKLSLLMGRDAADDFITRLSDEASLAQTGGRMAPGSNSTTFEALEAARDQDRSVGIINDLARNIEGTGPISGAIKTALESAYAPIGGFVRGAMTPTAQPVRDEIARLLLQSPEDLLAELARLRALGSATPTPVSAAPAVRAASPASGQVGSAIGQPDALRSRRSGTR